MMQCVWNAGKTTTTGLIGSESVLATGDLEPNGFVIGGRLYIFCCANAKDYGTGDIYIVVFECRWS